MRIYIKNDRIVATHNNDQILDEKYDFDGLYILDDSIGIDFTKSFSEQITDIGILKTGKKNAIKNQYMYQRQYKHTLVSTVLNVEIDCRESDVINMREIYNLLVANGTENLSGGYKCYDNNFVDCTTEQLGNVISEMVAELYKMWQAKETFYTQLDACTTAEEIAEISWSYQINNK